MVRGLFKFKSWETNCAAQLNASRKKSVKGERLQEENGPNIPECLGNDIKRDCSFARAQHAF